MYIFSTVLLLAFLILGHTYSALNKLWDEWKIKHSKVYNNQSEVIFRRAVWEKNMQLVLRHNQEASAGEHSFTMGLNHLADMKMDINLRAVIQKCRFKLLQHLPYSSDSAPRPSPLPLFGSGLHHCHHYLNDDDIIAAVDHFLKVQDADLHKDSPSQVEDWGDESTRIVYDHGVVYFSVYEETAEEINEKLNGLKVEEPNNFRNGTFKEVTGLLLPRSVDWRKQGLVSPVQNQGSCGSCWAFSSMGALEGQMKKRTGALVPLSPQNLVDCSTVDGNLGCRGGYISRSFSYVIRNRGVDSENFYPYEHQNGKCRYSVQGKAGYCSDFHILPRGDEKTLQAVVAAVGPVSVAVNAMLPSFHFYRGGLYNVPNCNPKFINHAVLVVGYGTEKGQDFWLVKNSWGTTWGEDGFIRIARNKKNLCGIASFAVYPTV